MSLRTLSGATFVVLLFRLGFGLLVLVPSAMFPETLLEQQVHILPGNAPLAQWLQRVLVIPWIRYDGNWYIRIIERGYQRGAGTNAFHPLYPLLAKPLAWALANPPLALLLVSTLSSVVLVAVFTRYVEAVHGTEIAQPASWLLLLAPPSFILLAPYNEGFFMLLTVGCLFALHRERWWLAGLLGGLATLTRQQGLALALPMAWTLVVALRAGRARWWHAGALALVPLGYGLFIGYRAVALGDLPTFSQTEGVADFIRKLLVSSSSETVLRGQRIAWPWEPLIDELRIIATMPGSYDLGIDLVLGFSGIITLLLGWKSITVPERLYALAIVGLTLCYYNGVLRPYLSMPRHIMIAFPLYIILARWSGKGQRQRMLLEVLLILNLFLAGAYARNGWVP